MGEIRREYLRLAFNQAAELYDRARPGYPEAMFTDLTVLARTGTGCRLLEIGCGTGQLTVPLAEQGCKIVAIDLGADLAAIARRKLVPYQDARVIVAAFEDWPLPNLRFDVVASATAFSWLDPAVRVGKVATALRPDGALATIGTHHVAGGDDDFFVEVQACYKRWDSSTPGRPRLRRSAEIPSDSDELDRSGKFGPAIFRRYEWEKTYSSGSYRDLLLTYSDHRALPEKSIQGLLDCITHLIDSRYGGKIRKRYLNELRLAYRLQID